MQLTLSHEEKQTHTQPPDVPLAFVADHQSPGGRHHATMPSKVREHFFLISAEWGPSPPHTLQEEHVAEQLTLNLSRTSCRSKAWTKEE